MPHQFRIGQMVHIVSAQDGSQPSPCSYKILRLLPQVGVQRLYRIKTIIKPLERIVDEAAFVCRPVTLTPVM